MKQRLKTTMLINVHAPMNNVIPSIADKSKNTWIAESVEARPQKDGSWFQASRMGSAARLATRVVMMSVNGALGPDIWVGTPPSSAATNPPTMAAFSPIRVRG